MKRITRCLALLMAGLWLSLSANAQSEIVGNWLTQDLRTHIQIYPVNGKVYGKITWSKDAIDAQGKPVLDTENPDKTLRNRPLIGLVLLRDFTYRKGIWDQGILYDPESGKTYNGELSIVDGKLSVKGKFLFLARTEIWQRLP